MLVQIIASNQFIINISNATIKCIIKEGYASIFETDFSTNSNNQWLWDIEDVNTLSQAIEVIYGEYVEGTLYKRLKELYNTNII